MTTISAIEEQINEIAIDHQAELATARCDVGFAVCVTLAAAVGACRPELRLILWPLSVLWVGVWWLIRPTLRDQLAMHIRRERRNGDCCEHS